MIKDYIDKLRQSGRVAFSGDEAQDALGISKAALSMALVRLKKKGQVISPYRNIYISIPPEYRSLGCLPADQLLPPLMKYIDTPYYICLLSAAAIHGAAHQRPQVMQVMASKRIRPIQCGGVAIRFIYRKDISNIPRQSHAVATGYVTVSTPEATIMDLLIYPYQSGGLNHIMTILTELIEAINPDKLLLLARSFNEVAWVQRLGYMLEQVDSEDEEPKNKCIQLLQGYIQERNPSYIPLSMGKTKDHPRDKIWRVIVNTTIESDI